MQRFRQAEPSWLRRGQTTTWFSSETEKLPVNGAREGGIASIYPVVGGAKALAEQWEANSSWEAAEGEFKAQGAGCELQKLYK